MKKHVLSLSIAAAIQNRAFGMVPVPQPARPVDPTVDHKRVCARGRAFGTSLAGFTEPAIAQLAAQGEPDERCKSCAFRAGTVPNGCLQTQLDALKAVVEQKPFLCHVNKYADGSPQLCHGWFAARWARGDCPPDLKAMEWWDFTPADPVE